MNRSLLLSSLVLFSAIAGIQPASADVGDIIFDGKVNKSLDTPRGISRGVAEVQDRGTRENLQPSDPFFSDEKPRPIKTATQSFVEGRIRSSIARSERKMERKIAVSEADVELYDQMRRVANWLSQYCVWNKHWPDPGDQENDAVRQLNDLCPNNPYQSRRIQEASGFDTDPIYQYYSQPLNEIPDASSGYEGDSMEPTTTVGALGPKRIELVYDPGLTGLQADQWKDAPPDDWYAPPGSITAISNSNNLIVVWGAGIDGKPLKVPGQTRIRLFVSTIQMQTEERSNY